MSKTTASTLSLTLLILIALAAGSSAMAGQTLAQPASAAQPAAGQAANAGAPRAIKPGDANCLRSTGSLIPARKGHCLPVAGRSYSAEQLRQTGATTTAQALQMLDPSITVGH